MSRPWTIHTFPKRHPIYIQHKGNPMGGNLVVNLAPVGVNIIYSPKGEGDFKMKGITFFELHRTCNYILPDGSLATCGTEE